MYGDELLDSNQLSDLVIVSKIDLWKVSMIGELRYQNLRDPPAHLREQETPHSTQRSPHNNTCILTKRCRRKGERYKAEQEKDW